MRHITLSVIIAVLGLAHYTSQAVEPSIAINLNTATGEIEPPVYGSSDAEFNAGNFYINPYYL